MVENVQKKALIFPIWTRIFFLEIAALEILYVAGAVFFSFHFLPKTDINGVDVSLMTAAQAQLALEAEFQDYRLFVRERNDESEVIQGSDIGLQYELNGTAKESMNQQNLFLWFVSASRKKEYVLDADVVYDAEKLRDEVAELSCMQEKNWIEPVEPQIVRKGSRFVVEDGVEGTKVLPQSVQETIERNVSTLMTVVDLDAEDCYVSLNYTKEDAVVIDAVNHLNCILDMEITYQFDDWTENLEAETMLEWVSVSEDYVIIVDEDAIEEYIQDVKEIYKDNESQVEFETTSGDRVALYSYAADAGIALDAGALSDLIMNIQEKKTTQYVWDSADVPEVGNTYIEIDLSEQYMYAYQDGDLILEASILSGMPEESATPTGIYSIWSKQSPMSLTGEEEGESASYWMAFDGNLAIHDAVWRNAFGGSRYLLDGSGGSVYISLNKASILYENYNEGDMVIIYDESDIIDEESQETSDDGDDSNVERNASSDAESDASSATESGTSSDESNRTSATTESHSSSASSTSKATEQTTEAATSATTEASTSATTEASTSTTTEASTSTTTEATTEASTSATTEEQFEIGMD